MANPIETSEAAAKAKFTFTPMGPSEVLDATNQVASVMRQHPQFGDKPEIAKGLDTWVGAATAVSQSAQEVKTARLELSALITKRQKQLTTWKRATSALVAAIDAECGGSAEAIKQWGLGVAGRTSPAPTMQPPTGLRSRFTKSFQLEIAWTSVPGHVGYFVQLGDGTPEGWAAPIACARARFAPTGLQPGQRVAVRVAVQRRTGLSAWSDVLTVVAR